MVNNMNAGKIIFSCIVLCGACTLVTSSLVVRNLPKEEEKYVKETGERPIKAYVPYKVIAPKIRSGYSYDKFNRNDLIHYNFYKDSSSTFIDTAEVSAIFEGCNLHVFVKDDSSENIKVTYQNQFYSFVNNFDFSFDVGENILANQTFDLYFEKGGKNYIVTLNAVKNTIETEVPRKLFVSQYTTENIVVDGERDQAYLTTDYIKIESLCQGSTNVSAVAYILWDDEYFYAFYEVSDSSVDTTGSSTCFENDGCEFWIDTCRTLPYQNQTWGYTGGNRGIESYCGEGGFKIRAGQTSITGGQEWMYDKQDVFRQGTFKKTTYGYNCEFKIGMADFKNVVNKENEIINIGLLVVDGSGDNKIAKGKIGCNVDSNYVWNWGGPSHMDHLKLIK